MVFPYSALSCVAPFPPAKLPAFIGTTEPSDSLRHICLSPSSVVPAYSPCREEGAGSPGLPHNHYVRHAMVSDPEEADITLPLTEISVLTSASQTAWPFPPRHLRGSIPSAFRFTACLLAVLRLKLNVATQPPRTCYPVAGLPSGTGFAPARLRDLARTHLRLDPYGDSLAVLPPPALHDEQLLLPA